MREIEKMHRAARRARGFFLLNQFGGKHSVDIGDAIGHSVRARATASPSLSRTNGLPTDLSKWSLSIWGKRGSLSSTQFAVAGASTDEIYFRGSSGVIDALYCVNNGNTILESNQLFRDPSAHFHLLVVMDAANGTSVLRYRVYYNGTEITSWAVDNRSGTPINPGGSNFNANGIANRFLSNGSGTENYDGVISRIDMVDGQVLTPSSFGRVSADTGAWVHKAYTGTYGNNGVSLRFGSVSSASDFGIDSSGNGNNYTVSGVSATAGITYDWLTDTPMNNFSTLNFLSKGSGVTMQDANLYHASAGHTATESTFGFASGKWYAEVTFHTSGITGGFGVKGFSGIGGIPSGVADAWWVYDNNINFVIINQTSTSNYSPRFQSGTTWRIAIDADNGKVYIGDHLGNWIDSTNSNTGNPGAGTNPTFSSVTPTSGQAGQMFIFSECAGSGALYWNFGQRPFVNSAPAGFKTLCASNLVDTSILQGKKGQNSATFSGNSTARSLTGMGFAPDLVDIKARTGGSSHGFDFNSVRGAGKYTLTSATDAEATDANTLTSFDGDGFSLGNDVNGRGVNITGYTYDAFAWKKGAKFGFDIVTYTGTGANQTIPHGLGVAPAFFKTKNISTLQNGAAYHQALGPTKYLLSNTTGSLGTSSALWNNIAPSSSGFTVSTDFGCNKSGDTYEACLWSEVPGYSKISSYTGNGSADGPFINCGFRPRWLLVKRADSTGDWTVIDAAINSFNVMAEELYLDTSTNDQAWSQFDFTSNGFKIRGSNAWVNVNGGTYVFMAFAEIPFKYATAR
ncbi:MAG TPA: hypothetical protein VH105_09410 [Burkholderiales bacterium]|nr:hypothetical protein [Burkholderiales bacterium]